MFCTGGGAEFVDRLFEKLEAQNPDAIIPPDEYPGGVFISFEGKDRATARHLARCLLEDGFPVWLDERKFGPGADVDHTIVRAIDRCTVFLPLISENSRHLAGPDGTARYHYREWLHAYDNWKRDPQSIAVIPVKIDNTSWIHDDFKSLYMLSVPGGRRCGDYERLGGFIRERARKIPPLPPQQLLDKG